MQRENLAPRDAILSRFGVVLRAYPLKEQWSARTESNEIQITFMPRQAADGSRLQAAEARQTARAAKAKIRRRRVMSGSGRGPARSLHRSREVARVREARRPPGRSRRRASRPPAIAALPARSPGPP